MTQKNRYCVENQNCVVNKGALRLEQYCVPDMAKDGDLQCGRASTVVTQIGDRKCCNRTHAVKSDTYITSRPHLPRQLCSLPQHQTVPEYLCIRSTNFSRNTSEKLTHLVVEIGLILEERHITVAQKHECYHASAPKISLQGIPRAGQNLRYQVIAPGGGRGRGGALVCCLP